MSNRNTLWAAVFVDEMARAGLRAVCFAPGSRHTPLVLAFARHEAITVYPHLDERSAAFFALGLALADGEPVALVSTSGTAGANFFPAIIEAHQSRVPLIVLTADRPHELRHSGANQTIDQVKLYGDYALWAVDAALPEADPPPAALRNLRTLAARAMAVAGGPRRGVVHINFPFRKPLEPTPVPGDVTTVPAEARAREDGAPYTRFSAGSLRPDRQAVDRLAGQIMAHERGLIVCGPRCPGEPFPELARTLARVVGYPLLADPLSGVRFGGEDTLGGYDSFLGRTEGPADRPEVVIRFGNVPTSKALNAYLDRAALSHYVHVSGDGVWADDSHRISDFVHADEKLLCRELLARECPERSSDWRGRFQALEAATWQAMDSVLADKPYFDGAVLADVVELIPPESTLFVGNSLPVRHLDQFGRPGGKRIHAFANRGASGIDGNTSAALGAGAAHPERPLVLVTGDITFYHDMNGLLAVQRCDIPITIVLLNNDGGGIFYRLPIRDHDPEFTDYFVAPHGLDFSHAARLYGLDYVRADDRESFRQAFRERVGGRTSCIIEVHTDARQDAQRREAALAAVNEHIARHGIT